jgi:hypothetical protein
MEITGIMKKNFEINENQQSMFNTAAQPCLHFGNKTLVIRKSEKENERYPRSWLGVHLQSKYQMTQYKTMKQKGKKIENGCINWIQDRATDY